MQRLHPILPAFLGSALLLAAAAPAARAGGTLPAFNCPDDGEACVFENPSYATNDVKVTVIPKSPCDFTWRVDVTKNGMVVQSVRYTRGNDPVVTVPPGGKAEVIDDRGASMLHDTDGMGISGSKQITPC